jgi:hypothetical protein
VLAVPVTGMLHERSSIRRRKSDNVGIRMHEIQVKHSKQEILDVLFEGLRRLEYRGYDSAGISIDLPVQVCGYQAKLHTRLCSFVCSMICIMLEIE